VIKFEYSMEARRVVALTSSLAVTRKMKSDCNRLIELLNSKGLNFEHVDLALDDRCRDLIKYSGSTVILPQVFINGKYIGSFDTVQELEDDGTLDVMLGIF
jgi:glutaredoxin 3